jgi:hypothetical protein
MDSSCYLEGQVSMWLWLSPKDRFRRILGAFQALLSSCETKYLVRCRELVIIGTMPVPAA